MRELAKEDFIEMYTVGKSEEGRSINALKFSGDLKVAISDGNSGHDTHV